MTLDDLAIKYGSDKSSLGHNYCPFYEKYLPKEPKRILEIGVNDGASLGMWLEYFPNAEVHGLDLFAEYTQWDVYEKLELPYDDSKWRERVSLHQGDQRDWKILEELRKFDFDCIIDDGAHLSRAQMITFFGLFNGKHYFIEDLHCADELEFYGEHLPAAFNAKYLFEGGIYGIDNKIVLINA